MNCHQIIACTAIVVLWIGSTSAQKLPPPSNTVYKCQAGGQTVYSDSPCLGAEKLEIEPNDGNEIDPSAHRTKLMPVVQRECQRLDASIPRVEAAEKRASRQAMPEVQRNLFDLRKRFRELGC